MKNESWIIIMQYKRDIPYKLQVSVGVKWISDEKVEYLYCFWSQLMVRDDAIHLHPLLWRGRPNTHRKEKGQNWSSWDREIRHTWRWHSLSLGTVATWLPFFRRSERNIPCTNKAPVCTNSYTNQALVTSQNWIKCFMKGLSFHFSSCLIM